VVRVETVSNRDGTMPVAVVALISSCLFSVVSMMTVMVMRFSRKRAMKGNAAKIVPK